MSLINIDPHELIPVQCTYTCQVNNAVGNKMPIPGIQVAKVKIARKFLDAEKGSYEEKALNDVVTAAIENRYQCEVITIGQCLPDNV